MHSLTMSQMNIYLSDRGGAGLPVNTLHTELHFLEKTNAALLQKAVDFMIDKSDIFRIRILSQGGEVFQDFSGKIKHCLADEAEYPYSELEEILERRRTSVLPLEKGLYDFTLFKNKGGHCVLSILTHHIIIDGYGLCLLCEEILRVYQLLLDGKAPASDTVSFAASLAAPQDAETDNQAFWQDYFASYPIGGKPFATKPDPILSSVSKGRIPRIEIESYCEKHGVTPYTVFTAALAVYLMRVYGTDETAIVIPRMNRSLDERKIVGDFVLPVPVRIRKEVDFAALCRQIGQEGKKVSQYKKYDYNQLIEDFRKQFGTDRAISDFTLNFQLKDVDPAQKTRMDFSACGAMRNLITVNISNYEGDASYAVNYDYRGDILSERFMGFFHAALAGIMAQGMSGTPVDDIHIVPDDELRYLKAGFKGEAIAYDKDSTIVSLFKQAVQRQPDASAVLTPDRDEPLTFAELDALSDKIAGALRQKGAVKGSLIGFLLERDMSMIPTMFGILKAGCAFLPLDINYPQRRIDYIINDSKAKLIVSTKPLAKKFGLDFVNVNDLMQAEASACDSLPCQNDLAYCIYTSGTTGQPKGVVLSHKGIVNITNPRNNPFNKAICEIGTGIVAIGSICFDISMFEIFVFLLNGKHVALAADNDLANGEAIAQIFMRTGANALHCTPTRLQSYLSGELFDKMLKTQMKLILSAGEVLPASLAALIADCGIKIYNGYGPTEVTIGATITEAGDRETIGKPIANTTIHILDSYRQPLPFGVTGEIAVTGDGVGLGYIGKDDLTAEKFVVINDERGYLTGDLGYFLPDGRLKYVARNDNQIKLRGYRIELGEIEQCALQFMGIENCAVIAKQYNSENFLVLYYSGEADGAALKEHMREFLSYYMVPQTIVRLETLPCDTGGKLDRGALEALSVSIEREYKPPKTREEEILCEAFGATLSLEKVGINDNFFEIGGTSLLAVKMMMYANKYDLDIDYATVFKYPTPRLLAKNIGEKQIINLLDDFARFHKKQLVQIGDMLRQGGDASAAASLENVFVTGATGFLGSHIVKYLLEDDNVKSIHCLVRQKGKLAPEKRLKTTLFYYFSDISEEQFTRKIHVVSADMTDPGFTVDGKVDAAIHCAANVAHFAYGDALKSVNIDAVDNLIAFCKAKDATLIHISTVSVAGHHLADVEHDREFKECDFYKGQIISNEYIYSKFAAEYRILDAMTGGLRAKIMRVGNLQGRMDDGEFQMNLQENAFARTIKAYAAIGRTPVALKHESVNCTPVDETAKAVLLLARLHTGGPVFHAINPIPVGYDDIFSGASVIGKEIKYMENADFEALVRTLSKNEEESEKVEGLLLEKSDVRLKDNLINADLTVRLLREQGFSFQQIHMDYVEKYLRLLNELGFFD